MGFILPGTLSGRSGGFLNPGISSEGPGLVGDVTYWFRADTESFTDLSATILATDTDPVRAIRDKSGTSSTIIAVENDARRPTFEVAGANGKPNLSFDATDDRLFLAGASATEFEIERTQAFSLYIVVNPDGNEFLFRKDFLGPGWRYRINGLDIMFQIHNVIGVDGITVTSTTNKITAGSLHALIVTYDGSSLASGFNMYINSETGEVVNEGLDNALSTTVSASNLTIIDSPLGGDLPEWSLHGKELSAANVSTLMTNSSDRYGITIS